MSEIQVKLTEFSDLIENLTEGYTGREWLAEEVNARLNDDKYRIVILTGDAGTGKSAFMAHLAATHEQWPRYFIRRDSRQLIRPGDAKTFLLTVGGQLATLCPNLFNPEKLEIVARQRIGEVRPGGEAVAVSIEELRVSPFYAVSIQADQEIRQVQGKATAVQIGRLVVESRLLSVPDLQYMGLLDPARILQNEDPQARIVVLLDALDELRFTPVETNTLTALDGLRNMPEIPSNLRFLVTSRKESSLDPLLGRKDVCELPFDVKGAKSQADLRMYAGVNLPNGNLDAALAQANSTRDDFTRDLLGKATGNFLYLRSVLHAIKEALADAGKRDLLATLMRVEELPDDLDALYDYFLASIVGWTKKAGFGDAAWRTYLRPVLGTLAVAKVPLSVGQLAAFTGLSSEDLTDLLRDLRQFVESVAGPQTAYRIYHSSFAEYLLDAKSNVDYQIDGRKRHERIADYYLDNNRPNLLRLKGEWDDNYGLRYLITHLLACLAPAGSQDDTQRQAQAIYDVILDDEFRKAQRERLGDLSTTLADLRTALSTALERGEWLKALECAGVYRHIKHGLTITSNIFQDAQDGKFEQALQRSRHYAVSPGWSGNWERVLQLYLAWEAAERGDGEAVRQIMDSARPLPPGQVQWIDELWDSLLARIARTLARGTGGGRDARATLADLAPGHDVDTLLASNVMAQPDPAQRVELAANLRRQLAEFQQLVDEGNPEATSMVPLLDLAWLGMKAMGLRHLLAQLAATDEGQAGIDRVLAWVLPNPYPRYRDIGLVAMGIACLAIPDAHIVRKHLQSILEVALNQEGITFTFCLPSVLLEEAAKRGLPSQGLDDYLHKALITKNPWGTAMRAHSARAGGLFWQNQPDKAFEALETANEQDVRFAGYGTLTLLSLANRCHEFGDPARITRSDWGTNHDISLLDGAAALAGRVRDPQFREERVKLVANFRTWSNAALPDTKAVLDNLAEMADADVRALYIDHVTARWASPPAGDIQSIWKVVIAALPSATTLDTVLARLFGLRIGQLSNTELVDALRLCTNYLVTEVVET